MKKFPLGLIIYEEDIWGLQSDCATHNIGVEGVGDGAAELQAEGVCIELLNVHHRSVILAREPALALSGIGPANIPGVTSRSITASAIIDEQTVGVKCLFESNVDELAVGGHGYADRRAVKGPCVNDTKKGDLLTPDFNHRGVEDSNITPPLFYGIMLRIGNCSLPLQSER